MFLLGRAVPILWSIHNTNLSKTHSRFRTRCINAADAGLSYFVPNLIAYCSNSAKDVHERIGYASRKSRLIENGIAVSDLFPDRALRQTFRRELALADTDFVVCSMARFDPQKDHDTLLDAITRSCATVPHLRLLLVGTGCEPQNQPLIDAVRRSGLMQRALLLGGRHDINGILNASDLLVVSSAFGEAMPLAVLEAAAVGLPVVSTAVGDIEDLDLADAVVPVQEPVQLANAIAAFATKPHPAEKSAAKRRLVESRFSAARMLSSYDETYRELLASTNGPVQG
jgi:glycosyltransferase involved in cell wall biosynthesis